MAMESRPALATTPQPGWLRETLPRGPSVPSVEADDPPHRSLAPTPVRHLSVNPATQRPTATQGEPAMKRPSQLRYLVGAA